MKEGEDSVTAITEQTDGPVIGVTRREALGRARAGTTMPPGKARIELAGDDSTLSSLSAKIGKVLNKCSCYSRADELVVWDQEMGGLRSISADRLRTFAEDYIEFYGYNHKGDNVVASLTIDMARAVLAAPQLHRRLPRIVRVNSCPQPVVREGGRIELLPVGYDPEFKTLTIAEVDSIGKM